ncbi:MAG TPA: VanZ family protein [Mucilaginibacter sp.]|nr:VanZ family protein [Mucilaginibacter sp.]
MSTSFRYYWPAILWALFILIICSIKLGEVAESPLFFAGFDKLVHCGLFFVIALFMATGYTRKKAQPFVSITALITAVIIATIYGGTIELLQRYFFPWRSADWNDLFADIIGILMAVFSIFITSKALGHEKK